MPRFLVKPEEIHQSEIALSEKESRHALSSLRLETGAHVELMDGRGHSARGLIARVHKGQVFVTMLGPSLTKEPSVIFTLALSVIKPDRMEWAIEKACELGVHAIHPVLADRSIIKLSPDRWAAKHARWKKIASETCKQCGLAAIPEIHPVLTLDAFLKNTGRYDLILLPTLAMAGEKLGAVLASQRAPSKNILGFVGPEGDFTPEEVRRLLAVGARPVTLGALTLRSETAAIYLTVAVNIFSEY